MIFLVQAAQWLISISNNHLFLKTVAEAIENIFEKGFHQLRQYFDSLLQLLAELEKVPNLGQSMENASHHLLRGKKFLLLIFVKEFG